MLKRTQTIEYETDDFNKIKSMFEELNWGKDTNITLNIQYDVESKKYTYNCKTLTRIEEVVEVSNYRFKEIVFN